MFGPQQTKLMANLTYAGHLMHYRSTHTNKHSENTVSYAINLYE